MKDNQAKIIAIDQFLNYMHTSGSAAIRIIRDFASFDVEIPESITDFEERALYPDDEATRVAMNFFEGLRNLY